MTWKSYPSYKGSGVEWLGEIPAHWEVKRLKRVLAAPLKYGANEPAELDDPDLPRYVRITDVDENDGLRNETFKSLPVEIAREYILREGDLLFARSGATAGKTFLYRKSWGACAYAGYLIRARLDSSMACPEFIRYFTASMSYWQWIASTFIQATIQNVSAERYASLSLPLPSVAEQHAIAAFLDGGTAKIDALIAKKERLLDLLQEKRTALITQAVTKGLDLNVSMKASGIEWLGKIPAHWDVMKTKYAASLRSGHTPSRQHPEYWENCTIPWFGLADVWQIRSGHTDYVFETNEKISSIGLANSAACLLPKGTVILSRTASVGFSAIMNTPMATTQDYVNWICGESLIPEFLLYVFRAMTREFERLMMGSTHQTIYMPDAARFVCPIPPLGEQRKIVTFIREQIGAIDKLIEKVHAAINHLREYRAALISAAVTGKIDVRGDL